MSDDSLFGDVIFGYSRAQAIEDGVLVDVSAFAKTFFKYPVAVTCALWELLEVKPDPRLYADETYLTKLQDRTRSNLQGMLLSFLRSLRKQANKDMLIFSGLCNGASVSLKAVCGPGDDSEPVVTIMFEHED